MALLSCVMRDAFFVSCSTAYVSLGTMSLSPPSAMARCLSAPPNLLHRVCRLEAGVPIGDLGILHQVMIFFRKHFLKSGPCLFRHRILVPLLKCEEVYPCLVDGMICRLQDSCRCEQCLTVLCKLDHILHPLEIYINWAIHLNGLRQGLSAGLEV